MKKLIIALGLVSMALAACTSKNEYSLSFSVPQEVKGQNFLLVSVDGNDTLATGVVSDTLVTLSGKVKSPQLCVVQVGGMPLYNVVVEPGKIAFDSDNFAVGTKSNDAYAKYMGRTLKVINDLQMQTEEAAWDSIYYNVMIPDALTFVTENPSNPYNQAVFQQFAMDLNEEQIQTFCENDTIIKANPAVDKLLEMVKRREAVQEGKPYINVAIPQADGSVRKLSDWITPGRYTIVDFWASLCNPCRREIPGLVEIYKQYKDAGIDVLGVAVWDEISDTEEAVKQLGINYPVVAIPKEASRSVTEAYGIMGIPFIMMIDPQGNIAAVNLRGEAIDAAVQKAIMSKRR